MVTKLAAARIAMAAGCRMVIARGEGLHPLAAIEGGARATWFIPDAEPAHRAQALDRRRRQRRPAR